MERGDECVQVQRKRRKRRSKEKAKKRKNTNKDTPHGSLLKWNTRRKGWRVGRCKRTKRCGTRPISKKTTDDERRLKYSIKVATNFRGEDSKRGRKTEGKVWRSEV